MDAHNDLPVLLLLRNSELGEQGAERYWSERWVPEARAGGVDVQVLPIYVAPEVAEASLRATPAPARGARARGRADAGGGALPERCARSTPRSPTGRSRCSSRWRARRGSAANVELFSVFHRLGVRMVSFTHWSRALLAEGSADEETGSRLPAAGVRAVAELERLGILLDVSHLAAASVDHVLELATRTVVATHSCSRALRDHHRNLSDEHLRAIAATGGVIGMNVLPTFVDETAPTLDRVVDHLEHMAEIAGIDHVGLGPDFLREYMDAIYPQYEEVRALRRRRSQSRRSGPRARARPAESHGADARARLGGAGRAQGARRELAPRLSHAGVSATLRVEAP